MIYVRAYFGIAFCEDTKPGSNSSPLFSLEFDRDDDIFDKESNVLLSAVESLVERRVTD